MAQQSDTVLDKNGQPLIAPEVGMAFDSEDKAYEMYNNYAGKVGFSIRKSHTKRRVDKTICQKYIVCSNEGHCANASSQKDVTRTGCDARVQFSVSREGIWKVQKVVLDHNHYLASPNKKHKLKSQRRVTDADRQLIGQIREAGMKPAQVYEFMKEFYGGSDKVPFAKMDSNNEIGRERKKYLECNDAQSLLDYLKNKQRDDPGFFYAAQIDEEDGRIANFFWADGQSIMDYACFGDAVSFDTTFQTNKFEMPFAPLLGTNHHKQTIIFGAALIFNESIESFVWLFETFLTAMSGKHPKTIFTDQDAAMARAIAYVFRNTSHRLCLWHICLNAAKHLGPLIKKFSETFLPEFKRCVYEERSEPLFIQMWQKLLSKYKLENNQWMANLYALRKKWATIYRDSFTADMNSTQRSEGMNNVFKKRFRRKLGLTELLVECEKVSASLRENELEADFNSRRKNPVTYSPDLPLLKSAAESYTKRMYLEFEEEFKEHFSFSCKLLQADESILTYMKVYCASMPSKFSV
nr:protein FAR1-RELATED SEQUENCE 5-like [Setaria viridis]